MSNVARIFLAVLLLVVAAYCVFGLIATFEPSGRNMLGWQIAYAGIGAAALIVAVWLLWLAWSSRTTTLND